MTGPPAEPDSFAVPWSRPGWLEEASGWIQAALRGRGVEPAGPVDLFHERPWSAVARVPTSDGPVYFKASSPSLAYEPALTRFLARLRHELLPDLLAVDLKCGWMLMRDCGDPLRQFVRAEKSLRRWREILPLYVDLQKATMPRVGQLLALGVPDRRLELLPAQFESLARDETALLVGQPDGLSVEEFRRFGAAGEEFARLCGELTAYGIPPALHHDDFHDGNLFVREGQVRFTDWGEAAVTHPFFTLVVMLRGASNSLDLPDGAPELSELTGWYLDQWTDYAPPAELENAVKLAARVGLINRALTWRRVISSLPPALRPEYAYAVPSYAQDYLNAA